MGRIGFSEMLLVFVLILVVFGPKRLPEIARQVGRALAEVRKVSSQFQREVRGGLGLDDDQQGSDFVPYLYGPVQKGTIPPSAKPAPRRDEPGREGGEAPANEAEACADPEGASDQRPAGDDAPGRARNGHSADADTPSPRGE